MMGFNFTSPTESTKRSGVRAPQASPESGYEDAFNNPHIKTNSANKNKHGSQHHQQYHQSPGITPNQQQQQQHPPPQQSNFIPNQSQFHQAGFMNDQGFSKKQTPNQQFPMGQFPIGHIPPQGFTNSNNNNPLQESLMNFFEAEFLRTLPQSIQSLYVTLMPQYKYRLIGFLKGSEPDAPVGLTNEMIHEYKLMNDPAYRHQFYVNMHNQKNRGFPEVSISSDDDDYVDDEDYDDCEFGDINDKAETNYASDSESSAESFNGFGVDPELDKKIKELLKPSPSSSRRSSISRRSSSSSLGLDDPNDPINKIIGEDFLTKKMLEKELRNRKAIRKHFIRESTKIPRQYLEKNSKQLVVPPVDILEYELEYVINVLIPGARKSDINVTFNCDNNVLCVSGEIKPFKSPDQKYLKVSERPQGKFERFIPLPPSPRINEKKISSHLNLGILCIRIPKFADDLNRISVKIK